LCEYSECDGRVQKGKSAYRPVPMLNLMPLGGGSHADCKEGRNERIERTRQTVVTNGLDQDCFGSAANQAPPVCQVWSRRPNRCAVRR
jgi:hypothetical protein